MKLQASPDRAAGVAKTEANLFVGPCCTRSWGDNEYQKGKCMNTLQTPDARWDVATDLYGRLAKLPTGCEAADVIEHAISLNIEYPYTTSDQGLLIRKLWRNARSSNFRSKRRAASLVDRLSRQIHGAAPIPASLQFEGGTYETPERVFVLRDAESRLRSAVGLLGPEALRCLDGMLAFESVDETAKASGISPRTVNRIRSHIRNLARPIILGET